MYAAAGNRPTPSPIRVRPPLADEVTGCPPHHWVLESGWQQCKKCQQRQEIARPDNARRTYPPAPKQPVAFQ